MYSICAVLLHTFQCLCAGKQRGVRCSTEDPLRGSMAPDAEGSALSSPVAMATRDTTPLATKSLLKET